MVDTKTPGDKKLSVPSKTLSLKPRVETGTVRQSFSHGRSKQVVVEKRGKRRIGDGPEPHAPEVTAKPAPAAPAPSRPAPPPAPPRNAGSGVVLRTLTEDERSARASALADAKLREVEERRQAEEEAQRRAVREAAERAEREAAEARRKAEDERHRHEDEAKRKAETEAKKRFGEGEQPASAARPATAAPAAPAPRPGAPAARPGTTTTRPGTTTARPATTTAQRPGAPAGRGPAVAAEPDEDEAPRQIRRGPGGAARPAPPPKTTHKPGPQKERGRLTVVTALNADEVRERSIASFRRRTQRLKGHASNEPKEKLIREVIIPEAITIQELANRMAERAVDVIRMLMKQGAMHKITDVIDADTAQLIAEELGHTVKRVAASDVEEGLFDQVDDSTDTETRSPVVTVMGHVDHGKTSLLDALRHANVVSGEAGGITQHIGAYQVVSPESGKKITFIDTPGHAAFTAMRARGAKVTDIVVLVVAADDGVMPQTVEAINHAKAARVPIIVAINKIDKPDAKPERVRTELLQHEVQVESFGGDVVDVEVSAKNKTNLDKLLEMIALQADILDLKTNSERPAEGTVIEAKLDRGRGPVATVLVQRGTLRVGDIIVAGAEMGRVRALISDQGETVQEAGPSVPVEVLGFNGPPEAGDRLAVVENEARARQVTSYRAHQKRENAAASISGMRGSLEQMMSQLKTAGRKEFPLIIKADVQGSLEAILGSLEKLGTDEVAARILHAGVGGISESDVTLAEGFNAAIIGFSVRANKEAAAAAKRNGIEIRYYNIIYDLVDDVKKAMSGLLAPTLRETMLGNAAILEIFNISKVGKVAGCRVTDGTVERGANVRLIRDNVVVHEGKLSTLKRFKDEVKEVQSGQECGMAFENYHDMRAGDVIECYRVETIQRSL
ncbi:translation initiation factor IF-2 [Bradyrhizobium diazoefficiens]|jgi:translation initiation factor IF-2|uniref:Translation initiation factor IF-2 n=7 Tax=Bradyrhizobium TaxID=374 RepID=IF2_BRADU|nr:MULTISPECIES: translation initiation factor IF-2 [Bradyrhizobium]Q89WA9.1 RecName: Full=Translation initiation factor IF-2 [Bradyrhizobium diazoefficiens USDA 110]MBP1060522.1 translation initiation factor IF-2 [Bradyrhizobium japonicum]AND86517.1 translation initiation factor IF-2 [Bradyrhizobium diazoefficiens USDA 110]AWO87928.1 translation initiation factor IF-2 [Bradyrhizobium diazoefficiens]MBP1097095.1 translation initiation factor IF-2 [Bradyrhizobium japonicum]MBR0860598.1 transla